MTAGGRLDRRRQSADPERHRDRQPGPAGEQRQCGAEPTGGKALRPDPLCELGEFAQGGGHLGPHLRKHSAQFVTRLGLKGGEVEPRLGEVALRTRGQLRLLRPPLGVGRLHDAAA